jgi:hypothetical protein
MTPIDTTTGQADTLVEFMTLCAQEIEDRCCVGALTARAVAEDITAMFIEKLVNGWSSDFCTDAFVIIKDS